MALSRVWRIESEFRKLVEKADVRNQNSSDLVTNYLERNLYAFYT